MKPLLTLLLLALCGCAAPQVTSVVQPIPVIATNNIHEGTNILTAPPMPPIPTTSASFSASEDVTSYVFYEPLPTATILTLGWNNGIGSCSSFSIQGTDDGITWSNEITSVSPEQFQTYVITYCPGQPMNEVVVTNYNQSHFWRTVYQPATNNP